MPEGPSEGVRNSELPWVGRWEAASFSFFQFFWEVFLLLQEVLKFLLTLVHNFFFYSEGPTIEVVG